MQVRRACKQQGARPEVVRNNKTTGYDASPSLTRCDRGWLSSLGNDNSACVVASWAGRLVSPPKTSSPAGTPGQCLFFFVTKAVGPVFEGGTYSAGTSTPGLARIRFRAPGARRRPDTPPDRRASRCLSSGRSLIDQGSSPHLTRRTGQVRSVRTLSRSHARQGPLGCC
jgi:hypothetical protein